MPITPTMGLSVIIHLLVIMFRLISRRLNINIILKKPHMIVSNYLGSVIVLSISVVLLYGGFNIIKLSLNDKHSTILIAEKYVKVISDFATAPKTQNIIKQEIAYVAMVFIKTPAEASNNIQNKNIVLENANKFSTSSSLITALPNNCMNLLSKYFTENKREELNNFTEINLNKYFVPPEKIYASLDFVSQGSDSPNKEIMKAPLIKNNKTLIYSHQLCQL